MFKKIFITCFLIFVFTTLANANPVVRSTLNGDQYTSTVLVYSNDEIDAYVPIDMINFNLFYTTYPDSGNFFFTTYIVFKDHNIRKTLGNKISYGINNNFVSTLNKPYPELFSMAAINFSCDNQHSTIKYNGEFYLDQNGDYIGSLITDRHPYSIIDNYSELINNIAYGCSIVLDKYKKYPKNADIIKKMRQK